MRIYSRISWEVLDSRSFFFRINKGPPPVSILNQINPIYDSPSHPLNINFTIILSSAPRSCKWSFFHPRPQNSVWKSPVPPTFHMSCCPHSSNPLLIKCLFSHLTYCTPTKFNLNLTNPLATNVR